MYYLKNDEQLIEPITLAEFCTRCEKLGAIDSIAVYQRLIPHLRALAANATLLHDFYIEQLRDIEGFKGMQKLSSQTLVLAELNNCELRMVFWPTLGKNPSDAALKSFAYTIPHDHNFHFMTICYSGSGYRTNMYSYDISQVEGYVDEPVVIESLGCFNVAKGDIMLYEHSKDIHTQIPPESYSVTINVIPKQTFADYQYYFDIENQVITEVVEGSSQIKYLEKLAREINHPNLYHAITQLKSRQLNSRSL